MKIFLSLVLVVVALLFTATPPIYAEPHQVTQGTEIHLTLVNGISSAVMREGDAIVAIVDEPVTFDSRVFIPAGTRVNGVIGSIQKAKRFGMFRGQAYMSISFKTMEIDSRLIPVDLSILGLTQPRVGEEVKPRTDVRITEGELLQQRRNYKAEALGLTVGLAFGGAYFVVGSKGKELEIPSQTPILVRLDNTITVPTVLVRNTSGPNNANSVPNTASQ